MAPPDMVSTKPCPPVPTFKERPILFNAPMVRATLDGSKTQTRRGVTRLAGFGPITEFGPSHTPGYDWRFRDRAMRWHDISHPRLLECCPYGQPGDRLWMRESLGYCSEYGHFFAADRTFLCSEFDDTEKQTGYSYECDMREGSVPSIHMPRRWSRVLLEVTGVRVERLQDISREDAKAEGCQHGDPCDHVRLSCADISCLGPDYRVGYRTLWEQINGAGSWATDPWVWAVDFRKATS